MLRAAVAVTALTCATTSALAGGFALREQSPTAEGEAFAGVAAGVGGLSSVYWNPANITQTPGWQSTWGFSGVFPSAKITPQAGTSPLFPPFSSGDISRTALVPSSATSYQFNNWLWLGYTFDAPYGLLTKANYTWSGQMYSRTSRVYSAAVTPMAGFKVNDWLSLGAGVEAMYFSTRLTEATSPAPAAPNATLDGHSWGVGYTLGATVTPRSGTELGVGFRSEVSEDIKGRLVVPPAPGFGVKTNLTLPLMVTAGLSQKITDRFTLNGGYEYTHWSVFNSFPVVSTAAPPFPPAGTTVTTLAFRYRDGHFFSVGGDYQWDPNLTLRAGLGYEISPITDATRSTRLPDTDRVWATIGASYQINSWIRLNASYAHIFPLGDKINIVPGNPAFIPAAIPTSFIGKVNSSVDIISASLDFRWDSPAAPALLPFMKKP
ncbi:MAG: outer membrane protein transport protein [Methylobacteriaceae bacterium]|nr:outer membrane protein transport protein [Methylobacteriaceae bacterium]